MALKLAAIAFYRQRRVLRGAVPPPKAEKVRERIWAGTWSER